MVFCNIYELVSYNERTSSHNPYFNRWFSAINISKQQVQTVDVTILILIDGFLQSKYI